ncbi:MAG TPA: hypothetical protein VHC22_32425 [Pirellulales bacterium]|nr:hypothetical protein [Pirellulales bacterium]
MPKVPCPHCRNTVSVEAAQADKAVKCPTCGRSFSLLPPPRMPPAVQMPPPRSASPQPQAQQVGSDAGMSSRTRQIGVKGVNRAMLLCTGAWVVGLGLTFLWMLFSAAADPDLDDRAATGLAVIMGSMCFWFFETLVFGAVMVVLWVVRENIRE